MAEYQIITNYAANNLNPSWVLNDTNLIDMAVGKLASLGSDQGVQLRAQTEVLQQQVQNIEKLRDLMTKFTKVNFVGFSIDLKTQIVTTNAPWDISALASSLPSPYVAGPSSDTTKKLIEFFKGINSELEAVGSVNRLAETHYRISFNHLSSTYLETAVVSKDDLIIYDPKTGGARYKDSYGSFVDIILLSKEPFAVPLNLNEYQTWLRDAATWRAEALNALLNSYQLSPVAGDMMRWSDSAVPGSGNTFFGKTPVVSTSPYAETDVGRVVQYTPPVSLADPNPTTKYYLIKDPWRSIFDIADIVEVFPVTTLSQPLIFSPTEDTLRDLRSRFSEASLQISQRNASQQLLVNSLLISYNYHFDAAANVLKAFNDLRSRLAGNV